MFEHPNEEGKKLIRLLARTAKYFNRIDVFDHLRKNAPPGTTGKSQFGKKVISSLFSINWQPSNMIIW